jgi:hypothetical protein
MLTQLRAEFDRYEQLKHDLGEVAEQPDTT